MSGHPRTRKLSLTLDDILTNTQPELLEPTLSASSSRSASPTQASEGYCVECRDQPIELYCEQCAEEFCMVCWEMLHRTGNRKRHEIKQLGENMDVDAKSIKSIKSPRVQSQEKVEPVAEMPLYNVIPGDASFGEWIVERAAHVPMRLTLRERKLLRLVEAALNVSEYTDRVDVIQYGNKAKRMVQQIREICAILSGLLVACDYKAGQDLFADRTFAENESFFQELFEIARRYKIMNPEKMRTAYGKLMYLLQDSVIPEVQETLEFSCVAPVMTVYRYLQDRNATDLLKDDLIMTATKEISSVGKTRSLVQAEIKQKEKAIEVLVRRYVKHDLGAEEIRQCLYSIADNHHYLSANRDPCDKMIQYLVRYFKADKDDGGVHSLAIAYGKNGARLSHSHETQFHYVHQTLHLWREILHDMFMLWWNADQDLLNGNNWYRLKDTGQGLQRVQACPGVSRAVHKILNVVQKRVGYWVGSSVVHLGDRNVPNALMFIDKYNQVPRILNPIVRVLDQLDRASTDNPALFKYIETVYEGVDHLRKLILADFFCGAFDGSGADNFFDAGSCIDGRLTSAWNWCSQIEKKPYYPVFLLGGFIGFDGEHFSG